MHHHRTAPPTTQPPHQETMSTPTSTSSRKRNADALEADVAGDGESSSMAKPSITKGCKKKKKKKKKNKTKSTRAPIPLVMGTTAASLAKKRAAADRKESSGASRQSSTGRKRKRKARASEINGDGDKHMFSSTAESLAVISEYHTLNKRLEQAENDESLSPEERQKSILELKKQQNAMGGLDRYQKASIYGAKSSKFVAADWVVPLLKKELEKEEEERRAAGAKTTTAKSRPHKHSESRDRRLRILDVGAIDNQYYGKGYDDWLDAVPIDLHGGQHDSVLQVDFLDYAHEYCAGNDLAVAKSEGKAKKEKDANDHRDESSLSPSPPQPFDAIVMSLVLNFQGDPRKRGDMLALASDSRILKSSSSEDQVSSSNRISKGGGMLFVVLPSASLDNSRYCDLERFIEVTTNPLFQLELVEKKRSSKLTLLAFRRTTKASRQQQIEDEEDTTNKYGGQQQRAMEKSSGKKQMREQNAHCYDVDKKEFDYGNHEMKRLQPPKPGAKRNNFAVILKSYHNRTPKEAN